MITKNTPKEEALTLGENCNKCGKCCSYGAGFAQGNELQKIADHKKISIEKLKDEYFDKANVFNKELFRPKLMKKEPLPFGPCIFLKDNKCEIHEVKPMHCRVGKCGEHGEELSEWYTSNFLVDPKNAESIRQWALRTTLKPSIPGATPVELVGDEKTLKEILEYKRM